MGEALGRIRDDPSRVLTSTSSCCAAVLVERPRALLDAARGGFLRGEVRVVVRTAEGGGARVLARGSPTTNLTFRDLRSSGASACGQPWLTASDFCGPRKTNLTFGLGGSEASGSGAVASGGRALGGGGGAEAEGDASATGACAPGGLGDGDDAGDGDMALHRRTTMPPPLAHRRKGSRSTFQISFPSRKLSCWSGRSEKIGGLVGYRADGFLKRVNEMEKVLFTSLN